MSLSFNKVCEVEDFDDGELSSIIDEIFVNDLDEINRIVALGGLDRKHWEIAMSVRALRCFDALHDNALILGVGAGTEITSFFLTNYAKTVFATDLYADAGEWESYAPVTMISNPEQHAECNFREDHLVVQHMDGCRLEYPDNMFDGIYSSSSIEHFGSLEAIQKAAIEMGRVLKPGGILTLSTEYKVAGPMNGVGWAINNTMILSKKNIEQYIIAPSGLALVDEIDTRLSDKTMNCKRGLLALINGGITAGEPNIIISHAGYVFCSIHLTLRKGKS